MGVLLSIATLVVVGACDDASDVPADLLQQQAEPTEAIEQSAATARPTTQELTEGPRVPMVLAELPLRLQVPESWKITRIGTGDANVWLEGATPHGEVQIDLNHRPTIPRKEYDHFLRGIQRRIDSPESQEQIELKQVGSMLIVDYREELKAPPMPELDAQGLPKLDSKGEVIMQTAVPMRWRQHIYVPRAEHAEQYELRFVILTKELYEQDRQFLEGILSTLEYLGPATAPADADPAPGTPPRTPVAPDAAPDAPLLPR